MSGLVMGLILKHSRSKGTSRLVAVVIGDCCRDDGTGAWPAIHTIAARAGTSQRTAQRSIRDLVQLGELAVAENAGSKRSNLYTIRIDQLLANPPSELKRMAVANRRGDKSTGESQLRPATQREGGCHDASAEGDKIEREGDTATSPDPSSGSVRDPSDEPSNGDAAVSAFAYPHEFEEFWRAFPRRDAKREALKAWKKLTNAEKALAVADVPERMQANWAGRELQMIPHAATYLNQRRWGDDLAQNQTALPRARPQLSPKRQELFDSIQRAQAREASGNGTVGSDEGAVKGIGDLDESAVRRGGAG